MKPKKFTEKVFVALSPESRAKLEEIAGKLGMSMSEYIRVRIEADMWDDHARLQREGKA